MEGFDPAHSFGDDVSRRYDDYPRGDEAETVDFLAGLAGDGAALELAIGTGRIALPLAARGVRVGGIELSPDMVARLREKPGGAAIDVTMGPCPGCARPARTGSSISSTTRSTTCSRKMIRCGASTTPLAI
jgi:hypothetical protein